MKRGIIMEITTAEITLLTTEGKFFEIKRGRRDYQLGEEIIIYAS